MTGSIVIEPVRGNLPPDFPVLRAEAAGEGFGFMDRLLREWTSGDVRFDRPGEQLLVARHDGTIAGIGGVTADPFDPSALRMRRFYVRAGFRRHGIARQLALTLLQGALATGRALNVNAGTEVAPGFWESMGFRPVEGLPHTHVWPQGD